MYGNGTHQSVLGKRSNDAFELTSGNERGFAGREKVKGKGMDTNAFWGGGGGRCGSEKESGSDGDGDEGSEKDIFGRDGSGGRAGLGDIVKTVSVTVVEGVARGDEDDVSRENSIVKFEHV